MLVSWLVPDEASTGGYVACCSVNEGLEIISVGGIQVWGWTRFGDYCG